MKVVADRKTCFDAAKKAKNYREFRSMLKGKGCTLAILKEAWSARDEKAVSPKMLMTKSVEKQSPKKTIKKGALKKTKIAPKLKKGVAFRATPITPVEYERYLTPVKKDRDDKHVALLNKVVKKSFKVLIDTDLVGKMTAAEKSKILTKNRPKVEQAITDLLYGYDIKTPKFEKNQFSATLKPNREWIGNESTVIKSVKAVFDDPNFYIKHADNCNFDGQTLKLTLKSIKSA